MITLANPSNFRQAVLLSVLAERPVQFKQMNSEQETEGVHDYQMKVVKMVQALTNGTKVEVSQNGQDLRIYPGLVTNNHGRLLVFDCGQERAIGYFLEVAMTLSLFGKHPLDMQLTGITNDQVDLSPDSLLSAGLTLWSLFGANIQGKVVKRAYPGDNHGLVELKSNPVKWLDQVDLTAEGALRRIRGVCYGGKMAPQLLNRVVSAAKSVLLPYCQDVWVKTDFDRNSPVSGYGIQLEGQAVKGEVVAISVDEFHQEGGSPEEVGEKAAQRLLDEVVHQPQVDSSLQGTLFLAMALSQKKISKVRVGRLTHYGLDTLRLLDQFLGVRFIVEQQESVVSLSCLGVGLNNLSRAVS